MRIKKIKLKVFVFFLTIGTINSLSAQQLDEARIMANFLSKHYSGNNLVQENFYKILKKRENETIKIKNSGLQTNEQEDMLHKLYNNCDSLLNNQIVRLQSENYLNKKLKSLDSIKILSTKEKQYISNSFINKSLYSPLISANNNFIESVHGIVKDTIYYAYLYRNDIKRKIVVDVFNHYKMADDRIKDNQIFNTIRPLLNKKYKELATLYYSYNIHNDDFLDLYKIKEDNYNRIVDSVLLRNGVFIKDSRFATALKYKKELKITEKQTDSLLKKAARMEWLIKDFKKNNPTGNFDTKIYQINATKEVLDKEQHEQFLYMRNTDHALYTAKRHWGLLEKKNMASGLDSATVVFQFFQYEVRKSAMQELYSIESTPENKQRKEAAENNKPELLEKLLAATINNSGSEESKNLKKSLAW